MLKLKQRRLLKEGSQRHENIVQLKMKVKNGFEFAVLTNEIYQTGDGMKK